MAFLKACGITTSEDGLAACRAGFHAVGLVFATSPRRVSPDAARAICRRLPASVLRVGVFTDAEMEAAEEMARFCPLDLVQLHGERAPWWASRFGGRAIVSLRPREETDLEALADLREVFAVLIDTWDPAREGGTGRTGDWGLAALAAERTRVILAGGLKPSNVERAIAMVRPFGVDVSSGVESRPGVKDHALLRDFARAALAAFAETRETFQEKEKA